VKYIINSGWWCADKSLDTRAEFIGDDAIRSKDFHKLWYKAIDRYSSPEKIIIVDSCSPIKPDLNREDSRLEFISLNVNARHSTDHLGKFCGCVRAMQLGMNYALQCNVDYYVYIEQDALIYGEGIIEYCISKMTKPYMFGTGFGTYLTTQQSMFIIRQDAILGFLKKLNSIKQTDNEICPEEKYHIATCFGPTELLAHVNQNARKNSYYKWLNWQIYKYLRNWDELPVGYGRVRPINFGDDYFYFQHGDSEELDRYTELTGIGYNK
jgi:hypothetical protein